MVNEMSMKRSRELAKGKAVLKWGKRRRRGGREVSSVVGGIRVRKVRTEEE